MKIYLVSLTFGIAGVVSSSAATNYLLNGSFEDVVRINAPHNVPHDPVTNPDGYTSNFQNSSSYLETTTGIAWRTTALDQNIEIWSGTNNLPAQESSQFAEILANEGNSALFQDVTIPIAGVATYSLHHRGRAGVDTISVGVTYAGADNVFGTADDSIVVDSSSATNIFSSGNSAWSFIDNPTTFNSVAGGVYRLQFEAIATASSNISAGNYIDNVFLGVVPEPSTGVLCGMASMLLFRRRR